MGAACVDADASTANTTSQGGNLVLESSAQATDDRSDAEMRRGRLTKARLTRSQSFGAASTAAVDDARQAPL
jgi:hypothetical protein